MNNKLPPLLASRKEPINIADAARIRELLETGYSMLQIMNSHITIMGDKAIRYGTNTSREIH